MSLPLRVAARIAWRETRSSTTRFLFVVLAVAVGVGALTGVRAFSQAFRNELLVRARSILAADFSATLSRELTAQEQATVEQIAKGRADMTQVSSTVSMASSQQDPNPLLVSLKVVDPQKYPFFGVVTLESGRTLRDVLQDGTAVVGQDLLIRLKTHVGSTLQLGNTTLRIADVVTGEPDALVEGFGLGPRVLVTRNAAQQAGLLGPGARATQRYLFRLASGVDATAFRAQISQAVPEAQLADFRESNPSITEALDRSTTVLSLVSLVALVLGAIAVAMAMHAHLQQRLDNIAMMKSLGATSSHILRIYVLQTLFLGSAGGVLGVLLGFGVDRLLPLLITRFINIQPSAGMSVSAAAIGFFTGLATTQLFTLPALLSVRRVRPNHVLRRNMEDEPEGYASWFSVAGLRQRAPQMMAAVLLTASLAGVAALLTDSAANGIRFALGLLAAMIGLLAAAWLLLRVLRWMLRAAGLRIPSTLRHGLANLYRPGNQTASVLTALGLGVMLSMTVFLVQRSVVRDLDITSPRDLPNVFLVDISPTEIDGVVKLVSSLPGLDGKVATIPVVAGRIDAVDGKPPVEVLENGEPPMRNRRQRTVNLSWSEQPPDGLTVTQGKWWQPGETALVSVSDRAARRYGLHVGSQILFSANGRAFTAAVAAVHKYNSLRAGSRSEFLFPQHALAGLPAVWYGTAHFTRDSVPEVQRAMFHAYPTVTVVNLADALAIFQSVVTNIARTIEFLAGFCIFAAVILLASSVAGTRFRRIREIVVLKTLGATRLRIGAVLSTEFLLLGALGAGVGLLFAEALSRLLVKSAMKLTFYPEPQAAVLAVIAGALLAAGAGWLACFRILGQKPLSVLREE